MWISGGWLNKSKCSFYRIFMNEGLVSVFRNVFMASLPNQGCTAVDSDSTMILRLARLSNGGIILSSTNIL